MHNVVVKFSNFSIRRHRITPERITQSGPRLGRSLLVARCKINSRTPDIRGYLTVPADIKAQFKVMTAHATINSLTQDADPLASSKSFQYKSRAAATCMIADTPKGSLLETTRANPMRAEIRASELKDALATAEALFSMGLREAQIVAASLREQNRSFFAASLCTSVLQFAWKGRQKHLGLNWHMRDG